MQLVLMRHAHDIPSGAGERELSEMGRSQAKRTAEQLALHAPDGFDQTWVSPALRAQQTADIVQASIRMASLHVERGLGPAEGLRAYRVIFRRALEDRSANVLLVAHNPEIVHFALEQCGESAEELGPWLIAQGYAIRLEVDGSGHSRIESASLCGGREERPFTAW